MCVLQECDSRLSTEDFSPLESFQSSPLDQINLWRSVLLSVPASTSVHTSMDTSAHTSVWCCCVTNLSPMMMLQLHNIHCIYCLYVCLYMYSKPYLFVFILFLYSYICVLHVLFFSYSVVVSCPQKSLTSCMTGRFLCWWSN